MRKTILTICFAALCVFNLAAQNVTSSVYGEVRDRETDNIIPDAVVSVKQSNISVHCDKNGAFIIDNLTEGKHILTVSYVGYAPSQKEITISGNKPVKTDILLTKSAVNLEQIVVTGTRTPHFIKDVPIRTEVMTSDAIAHKNAQNVYEALEAVTGVKVEQQCQFCNFSMVRMQGLGAEHTQILIDGEPIYSGLAGVYGLQQIGTGGIDRIEIVKGAGSALYGSSAVAGVINIISKEPSFEPTLDADVQFGSFGFKNFNAASSMRYKKIGINVFAQRTQADALDATQDGITRKEVKHKDGISDRVSSTVNNMGVGLYVFNPFTDDDKFVIRLKSTDEIRMGGVMTDDLYLNPFSSGTENIRTNRLSSDLVYTLPLGRRSEMNFSAAYVYHKRNATNDTFLNSYKESHKTAANPEGESPDVEMMRPYLADEKTFTSSLTFSGTAGKHNLLAGVQGFVTDLEESGLYCIDDEQNAYYGVSYKSTSNKKANEYGFFIQDEWKISHALSVVPGVRADVHSSKENYKADKAVHEGAFPETKFEQTSFNPRLAVKYEVSENLIIRANIGTGFRAPYGFAEDLHLCSGSPRVWKSDNLKGERSLSYNLSADYYIKNAQFSINLYRTDLKDKIQFVPAEDKVKNLGYTYQWENIDDAFVQGLEIGIKTNLLPMLALSVDWTFNQGKFKHERAEWADPEDETNQEFPNRLNYAKQSKYISRFPKMTGDIALDFTPGTWTFSVSGSLQGKMYIDYNSEEDGNNSKIKQTDTYMLVNCRIAKKLGRKTTLYAGGKNIFGYIQDEKHTDDAAFMYAPVYGAVWYAGLSFKL